MEEKKQNIALLLKRVSQNDNRNQKMQNILQQAGFMVVPFEYTQEAMNFYEKNKQNGIKLVVAALGSANDKSDFYHPLVEKIRNQDQQIFISIFSSTASQNPQRRLQLFNEDKVNMVTECLNSLKTVAQQIIQSQLIVGKLKCPCCGLKNLTEDGLWVHLPLYHCNQENRQADCPICKKPASPNIGVHYQNKHGPWGRGEHQNENHQNIPIYSFALVVVRRESDGKYLLVQEFANSGFWLPGGRVDPGESLKKAAIRECKEEAGVDIEITGILTIQHSPSQDHTRLRIIYYGRPIDENQFAKSIPCYESVGASYVSCKDIENIKLRGNEPLEWIPYVENGGMVYPLGIFSKE